MPIYRINKQDFKALKGDLAKGMRIVGSGDLYALYTPTHHSGPRYVAIAQFKTMTGASAYISRVSHLEMMYDDCKERAAVFDDGVTKQMMWIPFLNLFRSFKLQYDSSMVPKDLRVEADAIRSTIKHPFALIHML
ncbi:MAG: hypothetical protein SGARI_000718 [Bacillariaceae sp.]